MSTVWPALSGCDNEHLAGFAAIECLDDRVEAVRGATPVQRCDGCSHFGADWTDEEAATAVANATGRRVLLDPSMFQPFVLPTIDPASRPAPTDSVVLGDGGDTSTLPEVPDGEPRPLTSRRRQVLPRAASLAAAHQVPTASRGARVAPRSTAPLRAAGLDQFPIAGAIGIPNPGG